MTEPGYGKTAFGLRDWARDKRGGECASAEQAVNTGLLRMSPVAAAVKGARSLVIAVATPDGHIPQTWRATLFEALEAGLDIVSGMHFRLAEVPGLQGAAERNGRWLIDIRTPPADIPVATGRKRSGKRLLTVGTDCRSDRRGSRCRVQRWQPCLSDDMLRRLGSSDARPCSISDAPRAGRRACQLDRVANPSRRRLEIEAKVSARSPI